MSKKVQKKEISSIWIDVSKDKNNICIAFTNKEIPIEFVIENNTSWFKVLKEKLSKYNTLKSLFVIESTGSYHLPLCFYLYEKWYTVKLINPLITKKYTRANIRKCKTDKSDARLLSQIWIIETLETFEPNKEEISLKRKTRMLEKLLKQRQSLSLSIKDYEEDFWKNGMKKWAFFTQIKKLFKQLEKTIKDIEKEITEAWKWFEHFEKISEVKWVSGISTSIVLWFIWNKNFESKKSLVAFAWLDVWVKLSGTSVHWKWRISKRWSSLLRKTLIHISWGLMMHNEYFKKVAENYREKWKHYYEILIIIAGSIY